MERAKTESMNKRFVGVVAKQIHCKYNSKAEEVVFVETRQKNRRGEWKDTKWIKDDGIRILVLGNEKIQYYFPKKRLLTYINEHKDDLRLFHNGQTEGLVLDLNIAFKLACVVENMRNKIGNDVNEQHS